MNCFQKLLSSWWRTTKEQTSLLEWLLWIAFKNYYLRDEGQQQITNIIIFHSCELLSKIIIFVMKDNNSTNNASSFWVVNCFQKLLSSWWRTTHCKNEERIRLLWIAFKNYYLRDEGQLSVKYDKMVSSCELLSKIIIFVMKDNHHRHHIPLSYVVNCFQKLLSSWWRTTLLFCCFVLILLWIAFKNYYLRDEGQLINSWSFPIPCCELLSKIIIFVMKDNEKCVVLLLWVVVNCFQKLLSSWWRTTIILTVHHQLLLWIAFKNYYLRDEGQRSGLIRRFPFCCELLSKIIIFVMKDNIFLQTLSCLFVVNCFQKLLSSWWRTTYFYKLWVVYLLWIAFKNYYLRDEGQLRKSAFCCLTSCELLSKIIIFVMKDNISNSNIIEEIVVNCFQKLLSSWWRTTVSIKCIITSVLWIAFKNYYLRDEGQLSITNIIIFHSCELLSKIIIFVMKDNRSSAVRF